jgi:hypothetical protein
MPGDPLKERRNPFIYINKQSTKKQYILCNYMGFRMFLIKWQEAAVLTRWRISTYGAFA